MADQARAHFDGEHVVLDEPAPFAPGEALVVSRANGVVTGNPALEELLRQQGVRRYKNFAELVEGLEGLREADDLWEIIAEDRAQRRKWAEEKPLEEWF